MNEQRHAQLVHVVERRPLDVKRASLERQAEHLFPVSERAGQGRGGNPRAGRPRARILLANASYPPTQVVSGIRQAIYFGLWPFGLWPDVELVHTFQQPSDIDRFSCP
jgi:hypothetical protein